MDESVFNFRKWEMGESASHCRNKDVIQINCTFIIAEIDLYIKLYVIGCQCVTMIRVIGTSSHLIGQINLLLIINQSGLKAIKWLTQTPFPHAPNRSDKSFYSVLTNLGPLLLRNLLKDSFHTPNWSDKICYSILTNQMLWPIRWKE